MQEEAATTTQPSPKEKAQQIVAEFGGQLKPSEQLLLRIAIRHAIEDAAAAATAQHGRESSSYRRMLITVLRFFKFAHLTGRAFDGDALVMLIVQRLGDPREGEADLPADLHPRPPEH